MSIRRLVPPALALLCWGLVAQAADKPTVFEAEPFGATFFDNQFSRAVVADFNEDGLDDLVVTAAGENTLYLILARPGNALEEAPAEARASEPEPSKPTPSEVPEWEWVGLWTYNPAEGQRVSDGLVLIEAPGGMGPVKWTHRLELRTHGKLPTRGDRIVWPVQINRRARKVCVDGPYPTFSGVVDLPGDAFDGAYTFASCKGDAR